MVAVGTVSKSSFSVSMASLLSVSCLTVTVEGAKW